jgi:hypothetical protein
VFFQQLEYLTGGEVVAILQNTMNELIQNKEAKDRRISLWRVSATVRLENTITHNIYVFILLRNSID